ncbi:EF-hand domain-containing family member B-like [Folsomia candida]|nr:EF-hand domain-containing family member B-like [Folsomia candida]
MRSSERMKDNLRWCPTDESLSCVVRRFRQYPLGITGQATLHYGAAQDLDYPRQLIHGILSDEVTPGTKLINPPPLKWVDQLELNIKESVYESNKVRPVGRSHDQTLNLPPHIDLELTGFGKPSDKSVNAGLLVNPPKSRYEIEQESKCSRALYKFTHGDYDPGEQICRNYGGDFRRTNTFGTPTPNDVAGRVAKKVIGSWRSCKADYPFVSKVYADHLDFRYPKLGMSQEQHCIRQQMGDGFVYGKKSDQEKERPIREIIFNRCPNPGAEKAAKIMQNLKNWLDKARKSFRADEGPDFEMFYEQIIECDPGCKGVVDWDPFIAAMEKHRVPRTMGERDFMEALAMVGVFGGAPCDQVNYYALMDLLKGYTDPLFHCKTTTLYPFYCPHTNGCGDHFRTMYATMTSNMCEPQDCVTAMKEARVNGMPSVRVDRVPRKIRSTKDFTNYGDDGDAYSLIWPSVYTVNGITCRDAFREFTKEEMTRLLCLAKVDISHCELDRAWEAAQALDPEEGKCRVSYQTFREALCQVREENAKIQNVHIAYPTEPCLPEGATANPRGKRRRNPCCGVDP